MGRPLIVADEAPSADAKLLAAGRLPSRLTMITLGVADVAKARAFYERLGFTTANFENDDVCFFAMGTGSILGLFGRKALADDAAVPEAGSGFRGVSCALNLHTEAEVDAALQLAAQAGAKITKPAQAAPWGGYSGYFSDPDGHLWEVAYNPIFPLDEKGQMQLPGNRTTAK